MSKSEPKIDACNNRLLPQKNANPFEVIKRIKKFPKTRFYGSKRRILLWIYDAIKGLPFNTALDIFGGTGSVSLLLKAMGKQVTYNDILSFNGICAKASLLNSLPISRKEAKEIFHAVSPRAGFISKNFKGMFFTDKENKWLDGAIHTIQKIENENKRAVLYYCIFQSCLMKRPFNLFHRANLNLRLASNISRSFGNLTTWETSFVTLAKRNLDGLADSLWVGQQTPAILPPQDARDIGADYDLVYIDPPYISKKKSANSDTYLKRYHFLEGLAKYNEWPELVNLSSRIKSLNSICELELWHSQGLFKEALFELIEKHKKSIVVLSYVTNAYPSKYQLIKFFESIFDDVKVHSKPLSHALAKSKKNELLIIGRPT